MNQDDQIAGNFVEQAAQVLLDAYGPASVLINQRREPLHFFGPVDRFLKVISGPARQDVSMMVRDGMGSRVSEAIRLADERNAPVTVNGAETTGARSSSFHCVVARPVVFEGNSLMLVSFLDLSHAILDGSSGPPIPPDAAPPAGPSEAARSPPAAPAAENSAGDSAVAGAAGNAPAGSRPTAPAARDHRPPRRPHPNSDLRTEATSRMKDLTNRQREILSLIGIGLSNKEIAARLLLNQRTVESHRAAVMKKMGAKSLADLVRLILAVEMAQGLP